MFLLHATVIYNLVDLVLDPKKYHDNNNLLIINMVVFSGITIFGQIVSI